MDCKCRYKDPAIKDTDKLWFKEEFDKRDLQHKKDHDEIKSLLMKFGFSFVAIIAIIEGLISFIKI